MDGKALVTPQVSTSNSLLTSIYQVPTPRPALCQMLGIPWRRDTLLVLLGCSVLWEIRTREGRFRYNALGRGVSIGPTGRKGEAPNPALEARESAI